MLFLGNVFIFRIHTLVNMCQSVSWEHMCAYV